MFIARIVNNGSNIILNDEIVKIKIHQNYAMLGKINNYILRI